MNYATVNSVMNQPVATLKDSTELSLNGGGNSVFFAGSRFLIWADHVREHVWSKDIKGSAFVASDSEGELQFPGANSLKGGMAYKKNPLVGSWTKAKNSNWWFLEPLNEVPEEDVILWGIGRLLHNWEKDSKPIGCVLVEVTKTSRAWAGELVEDKGSQPERAGEFTFTAKTWTGTARFATAAEVREFAKKTRDRHPENIIPEDWKTVAK